MVRSDVLTSKVVSQQCRDYRLTTAKILYYVPDFPELLQSFLWQGLDMIPDFPHLNDFVDIWEKNLDGRIESIQIGYDEIVSDEEWDIFPSHYDATH